MGLLSNKIEREQLSPADHIYTRRHFYAHHGIYIGDGNVIHFTRDPGQSITPRTSPSTSSLGSSCPTCSEEQPMRSGVIQCCLDCFLSGGELYRFEYSVSRVVFYAQVVLGGTCSVAASDPPEVVLNRTKYLLQNGFGVYDLFKNNCEDFAVYCKTGSDVIEDYEVGRSGQVSSLFALVRLASGFVLVNGI